MMGIKSLLAILAVGSLVASLAGAERDTRDYCRDMRDEMKDNKQHYESAREAYKGLLRSVSASPNPFTGVNSNLKEAWENVIDDAACNENSAEYVKITDACRSERFSTVAIMAEAVKNYAQKCLTPSFWDEQLQRFLTNDTSGLSNFVSDQFIDQYRSDNPNERQVHFGVIGGENCCSPDRSHGALLKALQPSLGHSFVLEEDYAQIKSILERQLFEPCERYVDSLDILMDQAEAASEVHQGGETGFIESLSAEFQNAIFRYKFCSHFKFQPNSDTMMSKIKMSKFYGKG